MIEIQWATELELDNGTVIEGRFCHEECELFDGWNFYCIDGAGVEKHVYGKGQTMTPGPKCGGPGRYKLTKIEGDERDGILGAK